MKLSLLVSLLVLSTLLYEEAQGIRLGKVSISTSNIHDQIQKEARSSSGGPTGKNIACKDDEKCSGGILNRKLMSKPPSSTSTTTTTTTISKNHANDVTKDGHATPKAKLGSKGLMAGKEANLSVSPSPFTKYREVTPEQYPDIIDIAGMDYSPARRKPPIHN